MTQRFRGMIEDEGRPLVARKARGLGVREKMDDILVDANGMVEGGTGGMSVSPDTPENLPEHRRPPEFGGTGPDPVWELDENDLPSTLVYRADEDLPTHGFIEPAWQMELPDYEDALAETRDSWRKCA